MIFEHYTNGGWVGFDTYYVKKLGRSIPRLGVGIRDGDKVKIQSAFLIHKNTEFLPDLYKAIGHYLDHRKEEDKDS